MKKMKKNSFLMLLLVGLTSNGITQSVKIGNQVWTSKNSDVSTFRNGDLIPQAITNVEWQTACANKQPAWCYYYNNLELGTKYGKLYNWYAVKDPRGLAPKGWHIPTDSEWAELVTYLGGAETAGEKMKSTTEWIYDRNGTNSSGFSGLPAGFRGMREDQGDLGVLVTIIGMWWGYSASNADKPMYCYLNANNDMVGIEDNNQKAHFSVLGLSVRCIKD